MGFSVMVWTMVLFMIAIFVYRFITIVAFIILINMIIVGPYYSLIKRLRLYYRVKEQKRLMKEHPQHPYRLESDDKESEYQNLVLDTFVPHKGGGSFSLKKLMAFSRKDYIIISVISFLITAFKGYVYIAFFQQRNRIVGLDSERFMVLVFFIFLLVFISATFLITAPIIIGLRAILTARLKKKLQRLNEIMLQQDQYIQCEGVKNE